MTKSIFNLTSKKDYHSQRDFAKENPKDFWSGIAQNFHWFKKWDRVMDCNFKSGKFSWFEGAKTNISYNCLDRIIEQGNGDKIAIIHEPNEPGEESQKVTYNELRDRVCQFANLLKAKGIAPGDRVCLYMPMKIEAAIAMLACARIGAVHCVVFAGFSAKALRSRIQDCGAKALITSDILCRGDKKLEIFEIVKEAVQGCNSLKSLILLRLEGLATHRHPALDAGSHVTGSASKDSKEIPACAGMTKESAGMTKGGVEMTKESAGMTKGGTVIASEKAGTADIPDVIPAKAGIHLPITIWQDEAPSHLKTCPPHQSNAEDPLFILYTSGSTGKPKGILHTTGGYMTYAGYSFQNVFNPKQDDIFFCSADVGWITGHSYLVYGPLLCGTTTLMFEGVPTYPDPSRFWQIIEKHKVNIFYTAPTAIRALMQKGDEFTKGHDLSSLKTLGTVGEPINEEAWNWYNEKIGQKKCDIVDTWWQTETGGIMISSLAGVAKSKSTYAGFALPGINPIVIDKDGKEITKPNQTGKLCIKDPWPSMLRGVYNNDKKFHETYLKEAPGFYFAGDGAFFDDDGLFRIIGRIDDVINVSGHRLGTAEIENAINIHENIVESAVIGVPHDVKGECIYAFAIKRTGKDDSKDLTDEVLKLIKDEIGAIAKPEKIFIVEDLPKTRSGKIMRRILKKLIAKDEDLGDVSTLVNPGVVEELKSKF